MPHYKCGACRTRVQIEQPSPTPIVVFCPECRSALDHVSDLTELLGLRRVQLAEDPAGTRNDPAPFDDPACAAMALPRPSPNQ
jgi:hypothetical protein